MVFGFDGQPAAALYWLAGIHVLMTGFTDIPYGMFKMIPFRIHGVIDALVGLFLVVAPWILGFAADAAARNFFIGLGVLTFVVIALTDYTPQPDAPPREPGDRRRWRGSAPTG
ncbi:MAG TPA: SPW repeat protein [Gemmatimonadaceae bacterium]|nr:SPW repeat protein [Gemmatimonadaceae bacterium]